MATKVRINLISKKNYKNVFAARDTRDDSRARDRANPAIFEGVGAFSQSQCATFPFYKYFIIYHYYVAPFDMGCGPLSRILGGHVAPFSEILESSLGH